MKVVWSRTYPVLGIQLVTIFVPTMIGMEWGASAFGRVGPTHLSSVQAWFGDVYVLRHAYQGGA